MLNIGYNLSDAYAAKKLNITFTGTYADENAIWFITIKFIDNHPISKSPKLGN